MRLRSLLFAAGVSSLCCGQMALAQSLDGTATLTGHDGAIAGLNIEQLLKRLERRPLSGAGNFRSGSTSFDSLNIAIRFNDGAQAKMHGSIQFEIPSDATTLVTLHSKFGSAATRMMSGA